MEQFVTEHWFVSKLYFCQCWPRHIDVDWGLLFARDESWQTMRYKVGRKWLIFGKHIWATFDQYHYLWTLRATWPFVHVRRVYIGSNLLEILGAEKYMGPKLLDEYLGNIWAKVKQCFSKILYNMRWKKFMRSANNSVSSWK